MDESAERFWAEFEAETGEKVEARAIGTRREEGARSEGPWGLLVLTDASFRFRAMPSQNWLLSLFKSHKPQAPSAPIPDLVVPRTAVVRVSMPKRGFLARLFAPPFLPVAISWREGEGLRSETFDTDPSSDLVKALALAFPPDRPAP